MKLALFEHILYVSWKHVSTYNGLIHLPVEDLDAVYKNAIFNIVLLIGIFTSS